MLTRGALLASFFILSRKKTVVTFSIAVQFLRSKFLFLAQELRSCCSQRLPSKARLEGREAYFLCSLTRCNAAVSGVQRSNRACALWLYFCES